MTASGSGTSQCVRPHPSRRIAARVGRGKHLRLRRAAMLLSMRARGAARFGETNPTVILVKRTQAGSMPVWFERTTNLRLYEMTAGVGSLFPTVIYNDFCN